MAKTSTSTHAYANLTYDYLNGDAKGFTRWLDAAKLQFKNEPRRDLEDIIGRKLIDVGGGLKCGVVTVTPEMALELLIKHNDHNRPITFGHVANLASEIDAGRWMLTHQGAGFDSHSGAQDLQHRFAAIVCAGKPIQLLITSGIPDDAFKVIDAGKPRKAAVSLVLAGFNGQSSIIAGVIQKLALPYDEQTISFAESGTRNVSNVEAIEYAVGASGLVEAATVMVKSHKDVMAALKDKAVGVFTYWKIAEAHGEQVAEEFMAKLLEEGLQDQDPVQVLRKRLQEHQVGKDAGRKSPARKKILKQHQIAWLTAQAFKFWKAGAQTPRLDPRADDEFPRFDDEPAQAVAAQ